MKSFLEKVTENVDKGNKVDVIYYDFKKAFDTVSHKKLMTKLKQMKLNSWILNWIEDWLAGRQQRVVLNGQTSDWKDVTSGVVQGSVLGPVLFIAFIADLEGVLDWDTFLDIYADDTKTGRVVNTTADALKLQEDINKLSEWAQKWGMTFNVKKCKSIHFGYKNDKHQYKLGGENIEQVSEMRDLGVLVEDNLKPGKQCGSAAKRANCVLGQVRRAFKRKDKKTFLGIYKTYVRPHLEYAVQAWNPWYVKDVKKLEDVQKRAIRMIKGIEGSYEEKLQQLGLTTLAKRRERGDVIQVFKILKGIDDVDYDQWFNYCSEIHNVNTRSSQQENLAVQKTRLDVRQHFFSQRVVTSWNKLSKEIRQSETVNCFKNRFDKDISV